MSIVCNDVHVNPLVFKLMDKTPGSHKELLVQAPSDDVKQNWVTHIQSILDMQIDFLQGKFGISLVVVSLTRFFFGIFYISLTKIFYFC